MQTMTICPAQETSDTIVNAVCVDVINLGVIDTPWGRKPQVQLVFESDAIDDNGEQRLLIRTFHKHSHPMSALSVALKSWCGRNLEQEAIAGKLNLNNLVGQQARLKLQSTITKNGNTFDKIVEVLPPGEVHVQQVKYQREEE